jgi:hypothetical protein
MTITGEENITLFRMISMKSALKLEILGMRHSSGHSVYVRIKKEFNLKGSKQSVLEQFTKIVENAKTELQKTQNTSC